MPNDNYFKVTTQKDNFGRRASHCFFFRRGYLFGALRDAINCARKLDGTLSVWQHVPGFEEIPTIGEPGAPVAIASALRALCEKAKVRNVA
jgi:hypothetical protein